MIHPAPADERPLPGIAAPLAAAVAAGLLTVLTWWAFVTTRRGQVLEALAMAGSHVGASRVNDQADQLLATVSVPMVAAVILVVLAIGLARGRLVAGLAAAVAVGAANVSTQLLKYRIFERDDLLSLGSWNGTNTLPSGHTTVAASALVGLVLVVPPVLRALTAGIGMLAVSAYGLATLVNQWHRPSDVIAAVLVSCGWGCLAVAAIRVAERSGRHRDVRHSPGIASAVLIGLGSCGLLLALAAGFGVRDAAASGADRATAVIAYAGGIAAVAGTAAVCFGVLLRLLDATRPSPRVRERVEPGGVEAAEPAPPG